MDVTSVDYWATGRTSYLHRRTLVAKLVAWLLVLAAVIVSQNLLVILSIYMLLVAALLATDLPARRVLALAAYPVVFALVFTLSQWQEAGPIWSLTVLAKASAAALNTVLLIATTPYPAIFALLQRFVPATVGDALLIAYRSTFIIAERFQHMLRSIRLRGGLSARRFGSNLRNIAVAMATLLIDSIDYSQRLYAIMRLRGYDRRIASDISPRPWGVAESALAMGGLLVLATALIFRMWWQTLGPVSWLPLPFAIAALVWQGVRIWIR